MKKIPLKIAILGVSGHIGKNLLHYFSQKNIYTLFLFSRNKNKIKKIVDETPFDFHIKNYNDFKKSHYDVIINCVGFSNPEKVNTSRLDILKVIEKYDNLILDYLKKNKSTIYIFISSGAAYGKKFSKPVTNDTCAKFDINNLTSGDLYSIAKINAEAKHRSLKFLKIVDLRIFGFFSRFMNLNDSFFMSDVLNSIKKEKTLKTNSMDMIRDYVHPRDLFNLIEKCVKKPTNDVFDVYSKKPISKFEILNSMTKKYGLKYVIKKDLKFIQPTGLKKNYYSKYTKAKKIGYLPKYSSLETILNETKLILKK